MGAVRMMSQGLTQPFLVVEIPAKIDDLREAVNALAELYAEGRYADARGICSEICVRAAMLKVAIFEAGEVDADRS